MFHFVLLLLSSTSTLLSVVNGFSGVVSKPPLLLLSRSTALLPTYKRPRGVVVAPWYLRSTVSSSSSSSGGSTTEKVPSSSPLKPFDDTTTVDAVVCGGGPAGLLTAIMLAQKFPNQKVKVFDRLSAPPSPTDESVWSDVAKFYLIGLGNRGQKALDKFGVLEDVLACCTEVPGRMDWAPDASPEGGVQRIFEDRPVQTQVLPRDKLVGVLHEHILKHYSDAIELNYGFEVTPVDFQHDDKTSVLVRVSKCTEDVVRVNPTSQASSSSDKQVPATICDIDESFLLQTKLLIAADGTARTIASQMEADSERERETMNVFQKLRAGKPFRVRRYVDDNKRVYKTVPMKLPPDWRADLNYSARTKDGRVVFDALPADANGNYCGVILLKEDDAVAAPNSDPGETRKVFNDALPQFARLVDDETMNVIAEKPPSYLPSFRYAGPRLNQGDRTVILGDCAHTVKPYFGLGANSALEDVKVFGETIDSTSNLKDAVHLFSQKRAGEAEALVKLSRELDRPGKLGFVTFILPLILDSIFHGLAPKLFAPNTIAMLQREGIDFRGVRRRKRIDRLNQILFLGVAGTAFGKGTKALIKALTMATGRGSATIVTGITASVTGLYFLRKVAFFLMPGLAPADVLAKTKDSVTGADLLTPLGEKKDIGAEDSMSTTSA